MSFRFPVIPSRQVQHCAVILVDTTFFKDKYRDTFAKFCTQLADFFAHLDQYRDELASLLTTNFELAPEGWQTPASL